MTLCAAQNKGQSYNQDGSSVLKFPTGAPSGTVSQEQLATVNNDTCGLYL